MLSIEDIILVREHGCTAQASQSRPVTGKDGAAVPGVFATRTARPCGAAASWVGEWVDVSINDPRVITVVLSALCQLHYDQVSSGELPMLDSRHEPVNAEWFRLPDDPSEDAAWLAALEEAKVDNP